MSDVTIFDLLKNVSANIPGCLMTSIVDSESGVSLASVGSRDVLTEQADAYHAEMYRLIAKSMQMLDSEQPIEGTVLVGDQAIFVSLPFSNSTYFWQVVTGLDTTVGFTQALMRKYQGEIASSISHLLT